MIKLTIDNQTISVPEGTTVLDACIELGIVVPHFCYHKALGAVGACRLCAVHVETEDNKGVRMSCLVEAEEGMRVDTREPTAMELRRHVIEWLMVNHPHDCPVCDEGGECQLQDMTIAGGHSIRRYRGRKRTYANQDLGPFVVQEMNRCIQCYRCVRTYREYFGGDDFGTMASRNRVFYGRFTPGRLQSPFSGNICDVCPTGVFTDKTFRYKSRYWDLQEADSICPHCSLGCATIPGARYRELQRIRSGINEQVNGHFICDRGRFGGGYVNHPLRPRLPRAGGGPVDWDEALRLARAAIDKLADNFGGEAVAWLGSPRASLEANVLLGRRARESGAQQVVFECHPPRGRAARAWVAGRGDAGVSLADVRAADFILLLGSDPLNEAPMLGAAVRQAIRAGARAAVIDVRPVRLPFKASHLVVAPAQLAPTIRALASGRFEGFERHAMLFLEGVRKRLQDAKKPVLAGGADTLREEGVDALTAAAAEFDGCGTFLHLAGPNSYGAAMLAGDGPDFEAVLDGILDGRVRGLVCLECDPFRDYPDPHRAQAALARLETLIVLDYLPGEAARRADIFLPTTAPPESEGVFVNCEGRMQPFARVMPPGEPLQVTGDGGHPPRTFSPVTPGAEPRPAVDILADLLDTTVASDRLRREIGESDRRFAGLDQLRTGAEGTVCAPGGERLPPLDAGRDDADASDHLRLLPIADLFGSGSLAPYCPAFEPVRRPTTVILSPADAEAMNLKEGATAVLQTALGRRHVSVRIEAEAVSGLLLVPDVEGAGSDTYRPGAGRVACRLLQEEPS